MTGRVSAEADPHILDGLLFDETSSAAAQIARQRHEEYEARKGRYEKLTRNRPGAFNKRRKD